MLSGISQGHTLHSTLKEVHIGAFFQCMALSASSANNETLTAQFKELKEVFLAAKEALRVEAGVDSAMCSWWGRKERS